MAKRKTIIILLIIILLALLAACGKQEMNYHTEQLASFFRHRVTTDPWGSGLKESFVEENTTIDVFVLYENPATGEKSLKKVDDAPSQRWYIIKDQARLEEVFDEPPAVDFETQMIVITFSSTFAVGEKADFRPKNVYLEDKSLIFEVEKEIGKQTWNPRTEQHVCIYRMDKLEGIEDVEVVFVKP